MLYLGTCRCQPEWPYSGYGPLPAGLLLDESVVVEPPAVEPLTLEEAKLNHRIDGVDQDTVVTSYIKAARTHVERYLGKSLITQTRQATYAYWDSAWPTSVLPYGPVQSVESVGDAAPYVVTYVAGYGDDGSAVPEDIRLAMQLLFGDWWENREDAVIGNIGNTMNTLPTGVRALLDFHRARLWVG